MINNVEFYDVDEFIVCPDCGRIYIISEIEKYKNIDGFYKCEDCKRILVKFEV